MSFPSIDDENYHSKGNTQEIGTAQSPESTVQTNQKTNAVRSFLKKHKYPVLLLIIFLALRTVMELLAGPFPIGNDVVEFYVVYLHSGIVISTVGAVFQLVLYGLYFAIGNSDLTVKILMILLQGLFPLALYSWITSLSKDRRLAFLATLAACFYFPVMRISWDEGRNLLAVSLGLFGLAMLKQKGKRANPVGILLMIASALTDPVVFPIFYMVLSFSPTISLRTRISALVLMTAIFVASLAYNAARNLTAVNRTLQHSYLTLGLGMPEFLLYLIAPILVFVILALTKIQLKEWRELIVWAIICLALGPFLSIGYRYVFMSFIAIVPLTALGLARFRRSVFLKAFLILILVFAFTYVSFTAENPFPYYNLNSSYIYYMPTSFYSNTMAISENYATAQLLTNNAGLFSCNKTVLITSSTFYTLALTSPVPSCIIDNLGEVGTISTTEAAIAQAANTLSQEGKVVYILWFVPSSSSMPSSWHSFQLVDSEDGVGIFQS